MSTLIAANLILWLSIFSWFIPESVDKQASIDDTVVIEHKLNIAE